MEKEIFVLSLKQRVCQKKGLRAIEP